jgi:peptidoglycan/xylan/chitin deacetylase (PgdA/CDA1 family)
MVAASAPRYPDDTPSAVARRRTELVSAVMAKAADARGELTAPAPSPVVHPRRASREAVKRAWYGAQRLVSRPVRDAWRSIRGTHPVRLFTWHRVTDLVRDGMTIAPAAMAAQLDAIARTHDVVSFAEGLAALERGGARHRPLAVLTFDDAYRSVYTNAFPLLAARGMVATMFVPTDFPGSGTHFPHDADCPVRPFCDVMSWDEIADLAANGWTIAGHTASHARLTEGDMTRSLEELRRSMDVLVARGFGPAVPMAFCFGRSEDCPRDAAQAARSMGYSAVCTGLMGDNRDATARNRMRRIDLGGDHPAYVWRAWVHGLVPGQPGPDA